MGIQIDSNIWQPAAGRWPHKFWVEYGKETAVYRYGLIWVNYFFFFFLNSEITIPLVEIWVACPQAALPSGDAPSWQGVSEPFQAVAEALKRNWPLSTKLVLTFTFVRLFYYYPNHLCDDLIQLITISIVTYCTVDCFWKPIYGTVCSSKKPCFHNNRCSRHCWTPVRNNWYLEPDKETIRVRLGFRGSNAYILSRLTANTPHGPDEAGIYYWNIPVALTRLSYATSKHLQKNRECLKPASLSIPPQDPTSPTLHQYYRARHTAGRRLI